MAEWSAPVLILARKVALQHELAVPGTDNPMQAPGAFVGDQFVEARGQIGREACVGWGNRLPAKGAAAARAAWAAAKAPAPASNVRRSSEGIGDRPDC